MGRGEGGDGVVALGPELWRRRRVEGGRRRRNIKISGRSAALGYSVIKLKHLIKLRPLITGCRQVGVIYSNCGSRIEEQMFQSCWCHGMSSKGGGGGAAFLGRRGARGGALLTD